jgi:hypothetical protein
MKAKGKKEIDISKMSDEEILSLVAKKLVGRNLFPEMVADTKEFVKRLNKSQSKDIFNQ